MSQSSERFPRERRLTRGSELDVVRREGKRVRTEHVEVRVLASLQAFLPTAPSRTGGAPVPRAPDAPVRVGIVVPKYRHGSVARNRVKRRLRELVRRRLLPALDAAPPRAGEAASPALGCALLVRAQPRAYAASFDALARDVERAGREAARLLRRAERPSAPDPSPDPAARSSRDDAPTGADGGTTPA